MNRDIAIETFITTMNRVKKESSNLDKTINWIRDLFSQKTDVSFWVGIGNKSCMLNNHVSFFSDSLQIESKKNTLEIPYKAITSISGYVDKSAIHTLKVNFIEKDIQKEFVI